MRHRGKGSTPKQYAYATRKLNGAGGSKQEIARLSGFSPSVARNAKSKIESTVGYQNAVIELAAQSNNLALSIMAEYQARGLKDFSNKDLNGALNAISSAWQRFEKKTEDPKNKNPEVNPLRKVVLEQVERKTITYEEQSPVVSKNTPPSVVDVEPTDAEVVDLDF